MRATAIALIVSLITLTGSNAFASQDFDAWRKVAEAIPLGSKVKIHTIEGKRVSGTLMRVDGTSMMIKKSTRLPEPAVVVQFDRVSNIEKDTGGMSVGKALLIGLGAGAGALLTVLFVALAID